MQNCELGELQEFDNFVFKLRFKTSNSRLK